MPIWNPVGKPVQNPVRKPVRDFNTGSARYLVVLGELVPTIETQLAPSLIDKH